MYVPVQIFFGHLQSNVNNISSETAGDLTRKEIDTKDSSEPEGDNAMLGMDKFKCMFTSKTNDASAPTGGSTPPYITEGSFVYYPIKSLSDVMRSFDNEILENTPDNRKLQDRIIEIEGVTGRVSPNEKHPQIIGSTEFGTFHLHPFLPGDEKEPLHNHLIQQFRLTPEQAMLLPSMEDLNVFFNSAARYNKYAKQNNLGELDSTKSFEGTVLVDQNAKVVMAGVVPVSYYAGSRN